MEAKYIIDGEVIVVFIPSQGCSRWPLSDDNLDKVEQMVNIHNYQLSHPKRRINIKELFIWAFIKIDEAVKHNPSTKYKLEQIRASQQDTVLKRKRT